MSAFNTQIHFQSSTNQIIHNHITVETAAEVTGYNAQYLRRLLRSGKLEGLKIGQIWLIEWNSLVRHLINAKSKIDHRYGSKLFKVKGREQLSFTSVNTPCLQMYTDQEEDHERLNS